MTFNMKCHRCGGDLVDASPVEIYCPNDKCWKEDMKLSFQRVRHLWEEKDKEKLRELRKKYPDV